MSDTIIFKSCIDDTSRRYPNDTHYDTYKEYSMAIDRKAFTKTRYQNIKIHKDGITFWFDFTINGKRYNRLWKSNQNHSKADKLRGATRQLEVYKLEVEHQNGITANTEATVNHYWDILQELKKYKWSVNWMGNNTRFYDRYILNTLGPKKIRDIKPSMLTQFNKTISHLSLRTQKTAYEILNPIFNLAIEDEIVDRSPIKQIHIPKRKQLEEKKVVTNAVEKYRAINEAINQVFGTDELLTFEDGTKIQCNIDPHYRALFLFGFHGRRKTEVLNLQWEDVDFNSNTYTIKAKNNKVNVDMTFQLPMDAKDALREFREPTGRVFGVTHIVTHYKKIRKITGIKEFTFHWMRNLSVSALSSMGVEITHLSAMLGHTDSGTIRKYLTLQREASTAVTNEASQKLLK